MSEKRTSKYYYDEQAREFAPDDFWRQVNRVVGGEPVGSDHIELIVDAIVNGLDLASTDNLVDLCCGNGALSCTVFGKCRGGLGVDRSNYLIEVANKYFSKKGREEYVCAEANDFIENYCDPLSFNKAVCYGSLPHFSIPMVKKFLVDLRSRFTGLEKVFIGNVPDRSKLDVFWKDGGYVDGSEDNPDSPIGIWWDRHDFLALAENAGWNAHVTTMPSEFFGAHYRFDVTLMPISKAAK